MSNLFACLVVREFPAQAVLRLRPQLRGHAVAVMDGKPPLQQVCSLNSQARQCGATPGMTAVEMDTLPGVACLPRSDAEEEGAREAILAVVAAFSPRIEAFREQAELVCIADIAGTEKLFGKPEILGGKLLAQVHSLGMEAALAVCANYHAAVCLARGASAHQQLQIVPHHAQAAALAVLPLRVLPLSPGLAETFSLWGIRTLGELARLPEDELVARIGQQASALHQRSRGVCPHLFVPREQALTLREAMELDSPVELLEPLLFVLRVMLEQLMLRAAMRAQALASVTVTLALEGGMRHARTVRPALPGNDRALWLKLLHLDLQAHPPPAAVLAINVTAEAGITAKVQMGLFSPQLPEPMRLDVTLARIRAVVGEDRVGRALLLDAHHPDAFRVEAFRLPATTSTKPMVSEGRGFSRALKAANGKGDLAPEARQTRAAVRRLRPPELSAVTLAKNQPANFTFRDKHYHVEHAYGPWQTSGDWWRPQLWSLEQWDLIATEAGGQNFRGCLTRDALRDAWHVTALYD